MAIPKVSFVITVFNKAPYLAQVVHALKQQQGDFEREFIFVNDGSTDDSLSLLQQLLQDWPQARILSQANAGPVAATNRGITAAVGEFVKFCDGDDILLADSTRLQLAAATASDADVVFSGMYIPKIYSGMQHTQVQNQLTQYASACHSVSRQLDLLASEPVELAPYIGSFERALATLSMPVSLTRIADPRHFVLYSSRCPCGNTSSLVRRDWLSRVGGCDPRIWMLQDLSLSFRLAFAGARFVALNMLCAYSLTLPGVDQFKVSNNRWQERYENCLVRYFCLEEYGDMPNKYANKLLLAAVSRILDKQSQHKLNWRWLKCRSKYPILHWRQPQQILLQLQRLARYCAEQAKVRVPALLNNSIHSGIVNANKYK